MEDFFSLLVSISRSPAMYVGSFSLESVANFICGYDLACEHLGKQEPLAGWMRWVELRFGIFNSAWSWTRILLHNYGSDEAALAALPTLYCEFESERQRFGVEAILAKHEVEFANPSGISGRVPTSTATRDPFE